MNSLLKKVSFVTAVVCAVIAFVKGLPILAAMAGYLTVKFLQFIQWPSLRSTFPGVKDWACVMTILRRSLISFARERKAYTVYPPDNLIFNALNSCVFDDVKVVILGQDPYHGPGQAMGLSFSVPRGEKIPPSLRNIYKELEADLGVAQALDGDLTALD